MAARYLQKGETITASTLVRATPEAVYTVVSDVTRIPEWSPECCRCEWTGEGRFKGWNRRRFGRWSTVSEVRSDVEGREFSFAPQLMGRDFTQWTYRMEPGPEAGTTTLSEEFRLCERLNPAVIAFELVMLGVSDRRSDLRENLEASLARIKEIVEA